MRHWRRSRRTVSFAEAAQDVYIWLLAAAMLGSMAISVLVNVSHLSDRACTDGECASARVLLPWLVVGAVTAAWLAAARLLGPVAVSPGLASWLVVTPVDRGELLRRRVWGMTGLAALVVAPVAAATGTLAGLSVTSLVLFAAGAAGFAALGTGLLVRAQSAGGRWHPAKLLTPGLLLLVAVGLTALALRHVPEPPAPSAPVAVWGAVAAVLWAGVLASLTRARAVAGRLRLRDVAPGGALLPGLGGALSSLDLALAFDVVTAHTSRRRGALRSVRGGPAGVGALVWRDVVRLRRKAGAVALLFGALLVPYAVAAVGGGIVTLLVEVLVCFVLVVPLLVSLRVLTRSAGMVRIFPTALGPTRAAAVVVPAALVIAHGLMVAPGLRHNLDGVSGADAVLLGAAAGVGGLAAAARWITGRPPDYGRPLVASPAGAVPTNLYGSVLRGFDVALLAAAPLLLAPTPRGAVISLAISVGVLAYLCGRK